MSVDRTEGRRANRRAFRPTLDGALEARNLMSHVPPGSFFLTHPNPAVAFEFHQPRFLAPHAPRFPHEPRPSNINSIATQTANGGQTVRVAATDGSHFDVTLTTLIAQPGGAPATTGGPGSKVEVAGTVRAYPMSGGRVGLIVDGSTDATELDINPEAFPRKKGYAHSFAYGDTARAHILNIGQITVTSGHLGAVLGYHTANLSGPLAIPGNGVVDRIAFNSILPGAAIVTGGDLNTFDVLTDATFTNAPGVVVGRDLNWMLVGGNLTVLNGANFQVVRDIGLLAQNVKGTEQGIPQTQTTASLTNQIEQGALVQGNMTIGPGSKFIVGRSIDAPFTIQGTLFGVTSTDQSRISIPFGSSNLIAKGGGAPFP